MYQRTLFLILISDFYLHLWKLISFYFVFQCLAFQQTLINNSQIITNQKSLIIQFFQLNNSSNHMAFEFVISSTYFIDFKSSGNFVNILFMFEYFKIIFWWCDLHWCGFRVYILADIWLNIFCFYFFFFDFNSICRSGF